MHELPDRPPGAAELPQDALTALRAAVAELELGAAGSPPGLLDAVRTVAREARARAVPPERLLVDFKAVWYAAEAAHPPADRDAQARLFDQMISLCIREYFG